VDVGCSLNQWRKTSGRSEGSESQWQALWKTDPFDDAWRFQKPGPLPRILILVAVLCALVVSGIALVELAAVPPAHIVIVAFSIGFLWIWLRPKRR
jgi:hypothetical protein